ncbi:metallophosphoesterase [Bacteroidota bacterium]
MEYLIYPKMDVLPDLADEIDRVMVIGDIHGGYDSLVVFLQQNGVVDGSLNWSWGDGQLVFVGDIFDRGYKVTEALWLIYRLEGQAPKTGGSVQLILGNHEIMILSGNLNYVADKYLLMSSRMNINYSFLFGKKTVLGQWLRSKNTIIRINGHLFVHAGLSPAILEAGLGMHEINEFVRFFINHPDREYYKEVNRNTLLGHNGPFWYRGYLEDNHEYTHLSEEGLVEVLEFFDANYIFVGHTNVEEITPLYNNRVFAIDVPFYSNSHSMYGLLLNGENVYLLNTSGDKKQIR